MTFKQRSLCEETVRTVDVPSDEQSLTTITSSKASIFWFSAERTERSMVVSALYAGMITEISGPDLRFASYKSSIFDPVSYAGIAFRRSDACSLISSEMISDWSSSNAISFM